MDLLLFGAAVAAGLAGFYVVLGLQSALAGNSRTVRARAIGAEVSHTGPTSILPPLHLRWRPDAAPAVGFILPARYVAFRQDRRLAAVQAELPDTLTNMAKSLHAGLGLCQA